MEKIIFCNQEIDIDFDESNEKYLELGVEGVRKTLETLLELDEIEKKYYAISKRFSEERMKQGINCSSTYSEEDARKNKEIRENYKYEYGKIVEKNCTEDIVKYGYAQSMGEPSTYDYIAKNNFKIKCLIKSKVKMEIFLEHKIGMGEKYRLTLKNIRDGWLIDKIYYRFNQNKNWIRCDI